MRDYILCFGGKRMLVNIAILEDQQEQSDLLKSYLMALADANYSFSISQFPSAEDFLADFSAGKFHLIFADIQLKLMDGLSCMERVRSMDREVIIVFLTSMAQFAINGYSVDAKDFIVKPLIYDVFAKKMARLLPMIKDRTPQLVNIAPSGNVPEIVSAGDIVFVEVFTHSVIYHLRDKDYEVYGSLKDAEQKLLPYDFIRCSRNTIINPAYITGIHENTVLLGDYQVDIGSTRKKAFLHDLNRWMNK